MREIFFTATFMMVMLAPTLVFAQRGDGGRKIIKCESKGERYTYCRTNTTGRVELRKRLSDAPCREYDTWGADGDGSGVWVRGGCRAEFTVEEGYWRRRGNSGHGGYGDRRGNGGKIIKCESKGERYTYCRTNTTGRVELRRQLSDAPCREYETWGADGDGSGIWVRGGCRAEFTVEEGYWRRGGNSGHGGQGRTFTCKSKHYDYNHCSVPGGNYQRIELVRQISKASCERGNTWGEDRSGVWVMNGCEGEFRAR